MMNVQKVAAILLITAGVLGVAYGGFSYTSETHKTDLGPIHLSVAEREHVSIAIWVGVGAIPVCGLLLVRRKIF